MWWRWIALTLLEEDDMLSIQPKVLVLPKELLRLLTRRPARHDIPRHHWAASMRRARNLLEARDALCLVLEQTLVRRQADVVASLRRRAAQARALPAGHEEHRDLSLCDGLEPCRAKLALTLGRADDGLECVRGEWLDRLARRVLLLRRDRARKDAVDALDVEGIELRGKRGLLVGRELLPEV